MGPVGRGSARAVARDDLGGSCGASLPRLGRSLALPAHTPLPPFLDLWFYLQQAVVSLRGKANLKKYILMKHTLRAVATLGLAIYAYAELAAHVYPFVLLPHVGIPLKVMALT